MALLLGDANAGRRIIAESAPPRAPPAATSGGGGQRRAPEINPDAESERASSSHKRSSSSESSQMGPPDSLDAALCAQLRIAKDNAIAAERLRLRTAARSLPAAYSPLAVWAPI